MKIYSKTTNFGTLTYRMSNSSTQSTSFEMNYSVTYSHPPNLF